MRDADLLWELLVVAWIGVLAYAVVDLSARVKALEAPAAAVDAK